jgi:NAD-dependent deacetylase
LCPACGDIVKPDVVLYGEPLPEGVFTKAADSVCNCDLLIVGGTSLSVYPAALLINFVRHKNILLFNKTNTSADIAASEAISLPIGQAFGSIAEKLNMPL